MSNVHFVRAEEREVGDVIVSCASHWAVAIGEYADQGEPDILVRIVHAVNEDGDDISEAIANTVATAIKEAEGL